MTNPSAPTPSPGQGGGQTLLVPLTEPQQRVVELVAQAFFNTFRWPYFSYLEGKLDQEYLDARSILATFPTVGQPGGALYGAVSYDRLAGPMPDSDVRLTALGLYRVGGQSAQDLLRWFFLALAYLVEGRRRFTPKPRELAAPRATSAAVVAALQNKQELLDGEELQVLGQLLEVEGCRIFGSGSGAFEGEWSREITREVLRYDGVTTIEAYVEVMADRLAVPAPAIAPSVASPLGLVATLDYLDLAWRVAFKTPGPVVFPSGERTAKLCFPVQTVEEFDSRLSALWDLLKHLQVQGPGSHSLEQLQAFLLDRLEAEAHEAIRRGIELLQCVRLVRNAGQHTEAGSPAQAAWGKLGLFYPPASWSGAWQVIQVRVIEALDLIRQELPVAEG